MKRRVFLQLLTMPALASFWPRAKEVQAQPQYDERVYSDDLNTPNLAPIHDGNLLTGLDYQP